MKSNIIRCDFSGDESLNGTWWRWHETCDKCGRSTGTGHYIHSSEPGTEEADFCLECLKYFLRNNIKYEDAVAMYKK